MIGSENENELGLDNVAGIRKRTQFWGRAEIRVGADEVTPALAFPTKGEGDRGGRRTEDGARRR
jgi:hypothetical protein